MRLPLLRRDYGSRHLLTWLLSVSLAGCFGSVSPDLDTMVCQSEKNCPDGYVCALKGQPGGCKRIGAEDGGSITAMDSAARSEDSGAASLDSDDNSRHLDAATEQSPAKPDTAVATTDIEDALRDGGNAYAFPDVPVALEVQPDLMPLPDAQDAVLEANSVVPDLPADQPPCNGGCCTSSDCPVAAPICSALNQCTRCTADKDCAGRSLTACDTFTGACVQCTQNAQCGGTATVCDTATKRCVGCTQRSHCPGACQTCTNNTCVAVKNADDTLGCAGTCDSSGECKAKRGQKCDSVSGGCISGSTCADNFCCDQSCTEPCKACNLTAHEGTCTTVSAGDPPIGHGSCGTDAQCKGSCGGRSDGQCTFPNTSCGSPSCSGTRIIEGGHCASGTCAPEEAKDCGGGLICSSAACKTICGLDADCRSDYFCSGTSCHSDATAVASVNGHVCALTTNRTIHCWGLNDQGQLGDGTVSAAWHTTPATVSGITDATSILVGSGFSCVLLGDATVRCWGTNMHGELGIGDSSATFKATPVTPVGLSPVTALALSNATACAVEQGGTVKCWGYNGGGGVILGSTNFYEYSPIAISGVTGARAIAIGNQHACVLIADGTPKCWGQNYSLQAGAPETTSSVDSPRTADRTGAGFASITAGDNHTCVLKNGTATCWGDNTYGQLGNSADLQPQAAQVLTLVSGISALSAGENSTCALLTNGSVWCWGTVMSDTQSAPTAYPAQVNISGAKHLSGSSQGCAVLENGSVACWGWPADPSPSGHYLPSSPVTAMGW